MYSALLFGLVNSLSSAVNVDLRFVASFASKSLKSSFSRGGFVGSVEAGFARFGLNV